MSELSRVSLVSPYALSAFGGVQEQVLAMSRVLSQRGVAVQIVAPDNNDHATYDTPAQVVRLGKRRDLPANGSRAPLALSRAASLEAQQAVEAFRPDVVHLHEPFAPRLAWRIMARHEHATVATFHRSGGGVDVAVGRLLFARMMQRLDVTTAVSEAAATLASSYGARPIVLFNGFEIERFSEFERVNHDRATLVVVSRLEERKGVATVIEAVLSHNQLASEPWRLVIIGDGPERATLEKLASPSPDIEFLGRVDDETKRRWWRSADVALAPALHGESFGLIILEAMASSTRVVASDIDGYRQAAGTFGVLCEPGSPSAWVRGISHALATRDEATLTGALRHAREWSMSTLVDRYSELYVHARQRFSTLE